MAAPSSSRALAAPSIYTPAVQDAEALHFEKGALRPLPSPPPDHFAVFGLPQRLRISTEAVRDLYLDLSRRTHPDYFATADEAAREESLHRASTLNNAWKALRDPVRRAEYFLSLLAPHIESNKQAVPPSLLEEMFGIQEAGEDLREARLSGDGSRLDAAEKKAAGLRGEVTEAREALYRTLFEQFGRVDELLDAGEDSGSGAVQEALKEMRLTLDRMNYLRTVLRNLR